MGHRCKQQWIVIGICAWEGVATDVADFGYDKVSNILGYYGKFYNRQCESNKKKTCACQGVDDKYSGASFSFGCSWSMYFDGCKFGKGGNNVNTRKFKLNSDAPSDKEHEIEKCLQDLATRVSPLFERLAPHAYDNMCAHEKEAGACRIG